MLEMRKWCSLRLNPNNRHGVGTRRKECGCWMRSAVVLPFFDNNGIRTKPHKPLRGGTSRLKSLSRKGRRYLPHYSITSLDHPVGVA
jgi:hypothetical protein